MNHCVVTLRHVGGSLLLRCMPTYVAYPVHSQGCSTLPGSFDMVGPQLHSARQEVPKCPSLGPADMEAISHRARWHHHGIGVSVLVAVCFRPPLSFDMVVRHREMMHHQFLHMPLCPEMSVGISRLPR